MNYLICSIPSHFINHRISKTLQLYYIDNKQSKLQYIAITRAIHPLTDNRPSYIQLDETNLHSKYIEIEGPFHSDFGPAKAVGRSQTRPVFSLIIYRGIPLLCGYEKTRWDSIISTVIARATHTFAATLALFRRNRPGRWSETV